MSPAKTRTTFQEGGASRSLTGGPGVPALIHLPVPVQLRPSHRGPIYSRPLPRLHVLADGPGTPTCGDGLRLELLLTGPAAGAEPSVSETSRPLKSLHPPVSFLLFSPAPPQHRFPAPPPPPISVHAGERGPLARHPVSHQAAAAASVPSLHAPPSLGPQSFHRRWLRLPICYLPNLLRVGPVRPQPNPAPPPTPQGTRVSSSRRRSSSGELPALPPRRRCAQLPSNLRKLPYPRVKQR